MGLPIAYLRDDFQDNTIAATWTNGYVPTGSATRAETGGQLVLTPPTSTAGTHNAGYQSSAAYDLTGDQISLNVATMVSTSVAVTASLYLFYQADSTQWLRIAQLSGTLYFQRTVGGVTTSLATVAWSAATHKYWRIRESGGTIFFDTSTNGTSWTNRASTTVAAAFAVTDLLVRVDVTSGNVASPGQFKIDELNAIYPALSTNWHMTQVEWPLLYRFRSITLAASSGQGYLATSNDGTTWAYYSGPLGSSSGGYNQLTLQSSQAAAQAMAVNIPSDGRWDLPSIVECRFIRLYHRSITGSSYTLREYYPRRLVQSDDVEAESIRAINIAASSITADKLFVLQLSAIAANMGTLHMDGPIDITTGSLVGGGGVVTLDSLGLALTVGASYADLQSFRVVKADATTFGGLGGAYSTGTQHSVDVRSRSITGEASNLGLYAQAPSGKLATVFMQIQSGLTNFPAISVSTDGTTNAVVIDALTTNGLISLTSPTTISLNTAIGDSVNSVTRLRVKGASASSSDYALVVVNSTGTAMIVARNDNRLGFFGATEVARPTVSGSRATDTWRQSVMAALVSLGLWTDSSTV